MLTMGSEVADDKILVCCIVAYVGRHPGTCTLQHSSQCGAPSRADGLSANLPKGRESRDGRKLGRHAQLILKIVVLGIVATT